MKEKLERYLTEHYSVYPCYKDDIEITEGADPYENHAKVVRVSIGNVMLFRITPNEMMHDAIVSVYAYCIMKVAINKDSFRKETK